MRQIYTLIIIASLLGCTSNENNNDTQKDIEQIEKMMSSRFERFQNSTDPVEQARYYVDDITDDAIWMPQNGPRIESKAEVQKWAEWFFSTYVLVVDGMTDDRIQVSGDLAVRRFISQGYYVIKSTGDSVAFDQKYEDIYTKLNGEWKIASHAWSGNNMLQSVWNPSCPPDSIR